MHANRDACIDALDHVGVQIHNTQGGFVNTVDVLG